MAPTPVVGPPQAVADLTAHRQDLANGLWDLTHFSRIWPHNYGSGHGQPNHAAVDMCGHGVVIFLKKKIDQAYPCN